MVKKVHPHLRVVVVNDFPHLNLCKLKSSTAASPVGAIVRPFSISLTEEAASPTSSPISASVSPVDRNSETREDHLLMGSSIREPVRLRQRVPVTGLPDNSCMPRPKDMPHDLDTIGQRVRWWRGHRKLSRRELAKACGMAPSTLSDLELDLTEQGKSLHLIAAKLRLNAHYLQHGKGEPEMEYEQEAPPEPFKWPFEAIPVSKLEKLNTIERSYLETKMLMAMQEIEAERRKTKKS